MDIRLATLNDIEQICQLYNEFFDYNAELQPEYYKAVKESGGYPKSVIENEESDIFLAVENDTVIGFIHVREAQTPPFDSIVPHKYAEVIDLIVTALCRKKGIGAKLMNAAKQWGKTRNLDYIELFVLSDAKGEFLFYKHEGFDTVSHTMRCPL